MMKPTENDGLVQAVKLLHKTGLSGDAAADIGELFLAELQSRRQRLQQWLRIINAEASADGTEPQRRAGARRCRAAGSTSARGSVR